MKNTVCIVGGGLAGLLSSILLADKFEQVLLIEKGDQCGGLLTSVKDDRGNYYDLGTHIPELMTDPELNELLYGTPEELAENWTQFAHLPVGNFFNGQWNMGNSLVDTRSLLEEDYNQGILELLALDKPSQSENLDAYLRETVGPTFTDKVFQPILMKLYGSGTKDLSLQSSIGYFGLSRVIALTTSVTKALKTLDVFDAKLGYHNYLDQKLKAAHLYPKNLKGVSYWMERLVGMAQSKGVQILTNESVEKIHHSDKKITEIYLSSKGKVGCDLLIWTAAPGLALHVAGIPGAHKGPRTRATSLFHFAFDKELLIKESLYVWCWDSGFKTFRITLYPSLNPHVTPALNNLTAEVLSTSDEAEDITLEDIQKEMVDLGIVSKNAKVLSQIKQVLHNTFPVPTDDDNNHARANLDRLHEAFSNVMVVGRFAGNAWFLTDVIKETYSGVKTYQVAP